MPTSTPTVVAGTPWVLFCVSLVSVAVHLASAFAGDHGLWMSAFMIAMAAACLPCTLALLRSCSSRGLVVMISLAATSAVAHGAILLSALMMPGGHAGHAHHGATDSVTAGSTGHGIDLFALIVLEVGVMILASDLRARSRSLVRVAADVPFTASVHARADLSGTRGRAS